MSALKLGVLDPLMIERPVRPERNFNVVIVGGGAADITVAADLLRHRAGLTVAVIEPSETHSYHPGWILVGAGVFSREQTERREATVMPKTATWLKQAARSFAPERNQVELADGSLGRAGRRERRKRDPRTRDDSRVARGHRAEVELLILGRDASVADQHADGGIDWAGGKAMRCFVPEAMCDSCTGTLVSQHSSGTNVPPNSDVTQAVPLSCRKPWSPKR